MANPQMRDTHSRATAKAEVRRSPTAKSSRFARAARDPQWTAEQSAQARARLARQAMLTRQELLASRGTARTTPALAAGSRLKRVPARRGRLITWLLTPLLALLVLAILGSVPQVSSQTRPPRNTPSKESVMEMLRLIEVAKEAGLTEEQIRQITIEDEFGNVVNAWDYLQQQEQRKQQELARRQEELSRVYLTPQDVFKELRTRERADLDELRERLPINRERYR